MNKRFPSIVLPPGTPWFRADVFINADRIAFKHTGKFIDLMAQRGKDSVYITTFLEKNNPLR